MRPNTVNYWLFKTEPNAYSIDDLAREPADFARWDGIRNYQARNFLRDKVGVGDKVFIYHSQCKPVGIVGTATVVRAAYPDPAQFDPESKYFDAKASSDDPRWHCVDIAFEKKFSRTITLAELKAQPQLEQMVLIKQGRLSVQPVSSAEWQWIHELV